MTDIEKALEALIEKEDAAEELRQEGKLKQLTNEADRLKAGEIRKKAMESLGETKKRKTEESGVKPAKKTRSNGSETIVYLKEKHEKMLDMENKKLELQELSMEQANKRHEDLMTAMQQQQGQQMENFQVMMMQHQQHMQLQQAQQNELMLKLFGQMQHEACVTQLKECLEKNNENPMVRHECAEALGAIAKGECREILEKFAQDKERVVMESCLVALDMHDYQTSDELEYTKTIEYMIK